MNWKRVLAGAVFVLSMMAAAGWYWQSELLGMAGRVYLERVAAAEESSGVLTERRAAVDRIHRTLLLAAPQDELVPELFDLLGALTPRVSSGQIGLNWAAYVYTSYQRDLARDRPSGMPRRTMPEVETAVAEYVRFFSLRKRPDESTIGLGSFIDDGGAESYTVEEIEAAHRAGRVLR